MKQLKRTSRSAIAILLCCFMLFTATASAFAENSAAASASSIYGLTAEYSKAPLGLDVETPVFGWKMQSSEIGAAQAAYQIVVTDEDHEIVWDSGKVFDSVSSAIPYGGSNLQAETKYTYQITVWDQDGATARASSYFTTGVKGNWEGAQWITPDADVRANNCAPLLRTEAELTGEVKQATLYMTALGTYTAYVNGQKVQYNRDMEDFLNPGWTDTRAITRYQTYDVTDCIDAGSGSVTWGVWLANGWYAGGNYGASGSKSAIGDPNIYELCILGKLVIEYTDGSKQTLVTNEDSWKYSESPVSVNNLFAGETYDARKEQAGWNENGFDDSGWNPVVNAEAAGAYTGEIVSSNGEAYIYLSEADNRTPLDGSEKDNFIYSEVNPSKANGGTSSYEMGEVIRKPVDVSGDIVLQAGETLILDMGQNMVGVTSIDVTGEEGTAVQIRHAEMLCDGKASGKGPQGSLYTGNLVMAKQTLSYTLNGSGRQYYRPMFTYMGYRYVEITATAEVTLHQVVGNVVTSAVEQTGSVETNDADINQLFSNILWSQRGNFIAVPTDCPQRGERLGWTGDMQVFSETALYNFDVTTVLNNYVDVLNVNNERYNGAYGAVAPDIASMGSYLICGWSDVGVLLPWNVYLATGDLSMLEENYSYMERYMNAIKEEGYQTNQYGDHLSFSGASVPYMNMVYEIYLCNVMEKISDLLGMPEKSENYAQRSEMLHGSFMDKFVDGEGNILSMSDDPSFSNYPTTDNAQTAILWALKLDLYDTAQQKDAYIQPPYKHPQ